MTPEQKALHEKALDGESGPWVHFMASPRTLIDDGIANVTIQIGKYTTLEELILNANRAIIHQSEPSHDSANPPRAKR